MESFPMIIQAGDLGVEIDTGLNRPGKLQRLVNGEWQDYVRDGKQVYWPVKVEELQAGWYRVTESEL